MNKKMDLSAALYKAAKPEQPTREEVQEQPTPALKGEKSLQASRKGKKTVIAYLDPAGVRELKILAARQEKTQQDLIIEAVNDLLEKHGMKALA